MLLDLHNDLRSPQRYRASRLVVRDHHGNPIAVFLQLSNDNVYAVTIKDGEHFREALRHLGIEQTTFVDVLPATVPVA